MKILTISLIQDLSKEFFECQTYFPIFYLGNKNTEMVNFSFRLKYIDKFINEKKVKLKDEQIINFPIFNCNEGEIKKMKTKILPRN